MCLADLTGAGLECAGVQVEDLPPALAGFGNRQNIDAKRISAINRMTFIDLTERFRIIQL